MRWKSFRRCDPLCIAAVGTPVLLFVLILITLLGPRELRLGNEVRGVTPEAAIAAIQLIKDWGVWMAGIQAASLAAIAALVKEESALSRLSRSQRVAGVYVASLNGAALFFSAWLLTSLPSLLLRIPDAASCANRDVYEMRMYAWMDAYEWTRGFTLGFVVIWDHILWALGILSFATFALLAVLRPATPPPGPAIERTPDDSAHAEPQGAASASRTLEMP